METCIEIAARIKKISDDQLLDNVSMTKQLLEEESLDYVFDLYLKRKRDIDLQLGLDNTGIE